MQGPKLIGNPFLSNSFHPAVQRCKEIVASGEYGAVKHVEVFLKIPRGIMGPGDIRFDHALGGGAMMDMGCEWAHWLQARNSS